MEYDIDLILKRNRDGSFATKGGRRQILMQVVKELIALGYPKKMRVWHLEANHVD